MISNTVKTSTIKKKFEMGAKNKTDYWIWSEEKVY